MPRVKIIRVSEEEIAMDARRAHAGLERAYADWRAHPADDKELRGKQLDDWIKVLGDSRSRMQRAEAAERAARRKG